MANKKYTELWAVGLLDISGRFVITFPNLDHSNLNEVFYLTRDEAEKKRKESPEFHILKSYLYASSDKGMTGLGKHRISPFDTIEEAVNELKTRFYGKQES